MLDGNEAGQKPALRLRGYLVGNGVTDEAVDGDALVPFAAGKSLIRWAGTTGFGSLRPLQRSPGQRLGVVGSRWPRPAPALPES